VGERIDDKRDCKRAHLEGWNADVAVVRLSCRLRRRKDSYLLQTAMEGDVDLKKKSWVVRRCASDVPLTRASAVNTIIRQALDGYLGQPVSTQPIHGGHSMHVIRHCFAFGRRIDNLLLPLSFGATIYTCSKVLITYKHTMVPHGTTQQWLVASMTVQNIF
jgi:hypothetical protein